MGSRCRGMPRHRLNGPDPNEFPDLWLHNQSSLRTGAEVGCPSKTAQSSAEFCGGSAVELRGETHHPNMAIGTSTIVGSGDGVKPESGSPLP